MEGSLARCRAIMQTAGPQREPKQRVTVSLADEAGGEGHRFGVNALASTSNAVWADGPQLITAGRDGTVRCWHLGAPQPERARTAPDRPGFGYTVGYMGVAPGGARGVRRPPLGGARARRSHGCRPSSWAPMNLSCPLQIIRSSQWCAQRWRAAMVI